MASKLDPQLEYLLESGVADLASAHVRGRFGITAESFADDARPTETVVLVQYAGDPNALREAGLTIRGKAGDVWTGTIPLERLPALAELAQVERLEGTRSLHAELDLSLVECRARRVHRGSPVRKGTNVIVGIVDSGCDYTHKCFRLSNGKSRILFIWDQGLTPQAGESSPAGFGYGVEYDNAAINRALASATPFARVRHRDSQQADFHGTHVTGIAAGNGSVRAPNPPGGGPFVGVAPKADIIIVADSSNGAEGLGTSANTLDGVNYIFQRAQALRKAAAVNMSLGDNLGPHDGTSLLERGIDNLLGGAGRAFVKSAGNAGAARIHAEGDVTAAAPARIRFNQPANDSSPNQFDLWYDGAATFEVSVEDPAGNVVGPVQVGNAANFNLPGGNRVRIDHRNNDAFNGDKRIFLTLTPGVAGQMRQGAWAIRLRVAPGQAGGHFDAWIQRGQVVPSFLPPHESRSRTISTPGTASEAITAANYVSRPASQLGRLAASSSRGPTRDGRDAPTVGAPGSSITSAAGHSAVPYVGMSGTSMAAPHVTGTIALMFEKNPGRTQAQIKACLEQAARLDADTGPARNHDWGAGKMDSAAAVRCVPNPP
jgi:subtilisin family serine protease